MQLDSMGADVSLHPSEVFSGRSAIQTPYPGECPLISLGGCQCVGRACSLPCMSEVCQGLQTAASAGMSA